MRIFAFIFALLLVSCETDKENAVSQTEITNFVSEILSDTTNLKIIESKKTLISNFDFTPELPIEFEGYQTTRTQYISEILEEKDTLFIFNQINSKVKIDFNQLEKESFQIFDLIHYTKADFTIEEIKKEASKLNESNSLKYGDYFLMMKKPIFNKKRNKVVLNVNSIGSGHEYLLEKKGNNWKKTRISFWVE
jgi:hypothetical protein